MKPSVGSIVHYVSYGTPGGEYSSVCRAAVIAELVPGDPSEHARLVVLNPEGLFFNTVGHDEGKSGGTWHWPERVE